MCGLTGRAPVGCLVPNAAIFLMYVTSWDIYLALSGLWGGGCRVTPSVLKGLLTVPVGTIGPF